MSQSMVAWIGAGTDEQLMGRPPEHYKRHAIDCYFVLAQEQKTGPFPRIPARLVPPNIERCLKCGGG